ncbi:GNAT family N-acetyltransferase [Streptomyces sp. NPDC093249]|uniref:GNAT family N-acetyltransferase n=1 Tax=unclassified Streptomyces TaxID=2593676 RepID=UPI00381CA62A
MNAPIQPAAVIEENRSHPGLPALLTAYHLVNQERKGTPVATAAGLPAAYRAETEDPAAAFAADTVLLATGPGGPLPLGCVVLRAPREGRAPEVKRLWVTPGARRRGIARALMTEALGRASAAGAGAVRLTVWAGRPEPLALYEDLGFATVPSWDDRPGLLCLEKPLEKPLEALPGTPTGARTETAENRPTATPAEGLMEEPADRPAGESPRERTERHPDAGAGQPADRVARLTADEVRRHAADGLAALLVDAVDDGASVGFLAPLEAAVAASWWSGAAEEAERGVREVWAAHGPDGRLTGVVTLVRAGTANGRHRGEVSRLLVHRSARGRGLGRALLAEAEAHAAATGLTLLVLDTRTDSPAERLYRGAGWTAAGTIPDFAADPAGVPRATTLYYKRLG